LANDEIDTEHSRANFFLIYGISFNA